MLTAYRRVFSHPGALAFSGAGFVARLPVSMMTLGIVVLVSALTGSYTLAGQVSAAFVVGNAVFAIPHGRLADRFGQRPVLYADALVFGVATGLLVLSLREDWPEVTTFLAAVLAGLGLPIAGGMVRARWAHVLDDEHQRATALAVEGVVDEIVFVTGPTLVTFLSTLAAPETGLVVALVLGVVGCVALGSQRATEPPAHPHDPEVGRPAMPWRMLVPLTLTAAALGSLFGAQEVAAVAFAQDEGHQALSGVVLALFALGSGISGVVTGTVTWRRTALERARLGLVLLAVGELVLPWLPHLLPVSALMFLTGLTLAPTLVALLSIVQTHVPRSRLNEAMGFVSTGIGAGLAPGAGLGGAVADAAGGSNAFWVAAGSALVAVTLSLGVPEWSVRRHSVGADQ